MLEARDFTLSIEDTVLAKLRMLSAAKQLKLLQFLDSLKSDAGKTRLHSLEGLLEDLKVNITADDITRARREMWGNFPREID